MRPIYILLALLAIIILMLFYIAGLEEPAPSSGSAHPLVEHMRVGGDGLARFSEVRLPAFLLQVVILIFSIVLVVLGISERRRTRALYWWLGACGAFSLFSWHMLNSTYYAFLISGEVGFFLGFPVPTAWMIYGTWFSGFLLVMFYVLGFNRFIFTHEDEAEYLTLVTEFQNSGQTESDSELN